jgi:competence protein ComEA
MHRLARAALVLLALGILRQAVHPRPGAHATPAGERAAPDQALAADLLFGEVLDLNRATAEDLAALPGVGPVRAHAIIETRTARGGFASVDDLDDVPGIGPVTMARLRGLVTVGGQKPAPP